MSPPNSKDAQDFTCDQDCFPHATLQIPFTKFDSIAINLLIEFINSCYCVK